MKKEKPENQAIHKITELLTAVNGCFHSSAVLRSVRSGLVLSTPVVFVGSFALVFSSFPLEFYRRFMTSLFGSSWLQFCESVRSASFGIISIIVLLCVSYMYALEKKRPREGESVPVIGAVVSLCALFALTGSVDGFLRNIFGPPGLFMALTAAVISSMIFQRLCSIEALRLRSYSNASNIIFGDAVQSIFPAVLTISLFGFIRVLLHEISGTDDIGTAFAGIFPRLFSAATPSAGSALCVILIIHALWFLGVHGSNMMEPVVAALFTPAIVKNASAAAAGTLPTEIFTKTFIDSFVLVGGCGGTLCLVIALLAFGKQHSITKQAKLSLIPSVFNINELVVFGLPIVLNPFYLVPFIALPVISALTSYAAIRTGLVPHTVHAVEWTTPVFISGYVSTGSIAGSLLQLVNIVIGVAVYLPFIRLSERSAVSLMNSGITRTSSFVESSAASYGGFSLLSRHDDFGTTARVLAADLERDFEKGKIKVKYQPQVESSGRVCGAETLLRWEHELYGPVNPTLAVTIAEEIGLSDRLGFGIIDRACIDLSEIIRSGNGDFVMSVNVSSLQLENPLFTDTLRGIAAERGVPPCNLKIEITERAALVGTSETTRNLKELKERGFLLAMDDFGMGHSSLMYLKEFHFDTIKIDGSLVKELFRNPTCQNIISTITELGNSINFLVVAEFVENEMIRDKLEELGCRVFQGYLYSPAVGIDELIRFIAGHETAHAPAVPHN
jgi:lactose/cellobiose-specific phosphotransferase system IIC component